MIGLILPLLTAATLAASPVTDTLRLEVGSTEVNGRIYAPHAARVRVRRGAGEGRLVAEWTNELTLDDSAGRPIMRWVTRGMQFPPSGDTLRWELRQTYDAVTLAPYAYVSRSSSGGYARLVIDSGRVTGVRRTPSDTGEQRVDLVLDRPGFISAASDLVPLAAGLEAGRVMTAPMWGPGMPASELRIFTVIGREQVDVEGSPVEAWRVEERQHADGRLVATWWLTEASPYMVYGEVVLPNGEVQRMTEVAIPCVDTCSSSR